MLLEIQKQIETAYRVTCPVQVDGFILEETDRRILSRKIPWLTHSYEALVIEEDTEGLHLGLLFEPKLLKQSQSLEWESISPGQLQTVAPLIEGVSHFIYLLWQAEHEHPVTQLELELQAEVDKFILLSRSKSWKEKEELIDSLFSNIAWRTDLNPSEEERYKTAARLASQYCHYLVHQDFRPGREEEIDRELWSFYRMPQAEKIRHILS